MFLSTSILPKKNADIARKARFLWKQGKIQAAWTSNCKVFVKMNGTPEQAKVLCIRSIEQLEKLGSTLSKPHESPQVVPFIFISYFLLILSLCLIV